MNEKLLSPNIWVGVFCLLAVIGIGLQIASVVLELPTLRLVGLGFLAPLLLGGFLLIVVVIPILIVANMRHPKNDK